MSEIHRHGLAFAHFMVVGDEVDVVQCFETWMSGPFDRNVAGALIPRLFYDESRVSWPSLTSFREFWLDIGDPGIGRDMRKATRLVSSFHHL